MNNHNNHRRPILIPTVSQRLHDNPPNATDPLSVTAWDLYNYNASTLDRGIIKDWTETLSFLLVFAALFSAILTAFIIESMKLLQEDSEETIRDILMVMTLQMSNQTISPYTKQPFIAPRYAIEVNCMFFASLSSSLVAALASVIVLQWIGDYEAGLTKTRTPHDRAVWRHFRFVGIQNWRMREIIAALPTFIYVSLLLFFAGLVDWLWHVYTAVAVVVTIVFSIGVIFFVATTAIAITHPQAPYRTPVSKYLLHLIVVSYGWFYPAMKAVKATLAGQWFSWEAWNQNRDRAEQRRLRTGTRETRAIRADKSLDLSTLLWLSNTIEVAPHSYGQFFVLLQHFMQLPPHQIANIHSHKGPWDALSDLLCSRYTHKKQRSDYQPEEEIEALQIANYLVFLGLAGKFGEQLLRSLESDSGEPLAIYLVAGIARWRHSTELCCDLFDTVCSSWDTIPDSTFQFALLTMQRDVRSIPESRESTRYMRSLSRVCIIPPHSLKSATLISNQALETIFSIVVEAASTRQISEPIDLDEYLSHARKSSFFRTEIVQDLHHGIQTQFLASLARAQSMIEAREKLDLVRKLVMMHPRGGQKVELVHALISVVLDIQRTFIVKRELQKDRLELGRDARKTISLALPTKTLEPLPDRPFQHFIQAMEGFDMLMTGRTGAYPIDPATSEQRVVIVQEIIGYWLPKESSVREDAVGRVRSLDDPAVSLIASLAAGSWCHNIPGLDSKLWKDAAWEYAVQQWCHRFFVTRSTPQPTDISFIQTLLSRPEVTYRDSATHFVDKMRSSLFQPEKQVRNLLRSPSFNYRHSVDSHWGEANTQLATFSLIHSFPWFSSQFISTRGIGWLERRAKKGASNQDFAHILTILGPIVASKYEIRRCTALATECVQRLRLSKGENSSFGGLATALAVLLNEQVIKRRIDWVPKHEVSFESTQDILQLPPQQWNIWCSNVVNLIATLRGRTVHVDSSYRFQRLL